MERKSADLRNRTYLVTEFPLAGFYVVEFENVEEIIDLVSNTPFTRARGVVEIRSVRNFATKAHNNRIQRTAVRAVAGLIT